MADAPTAEDRSRYETLKKELMQALPKKRAIDKQLVSIVLASPLCDSLRRFLGPAGTSNLHPRELVFDGYGSPQRRKYYTRLRWIPEKPKFGSEEARSPRPGSHFFEQQSDDAKGKAPVSSQKLWHSNICAVFGIAGRGRGIDCDDR